MAMLPDLPPIFLLPTHLQADRVRELEEMIPSLTCDVNEAAIIVGNIAKRERALFELRRRKLLTEPVEETEAAESQTKTSRKRKRDSTLTDSDSTVYAKNGESLWRTSAAENHSASNIIKVVKLAWLTECLESGKVPPLDDYLIYEGRKKDTPMTPGTTRESDSFSRAAADATSQAPRSGSRAGGSPLAAYRAAPSLVRQTTSEHDSAPKLPSIPSFLKTKYSCQRATPVSPPNSAFVEELKKIRTTRKLLGDRIGVRAYSTSIATISAYPYIVYDPQEIARLPGCGAKIAELWHEWEETGRLREVDEAQADPKLSVIQIFYDIWGVGDTIAREFYNKGWRDLDDVIEYGWDSLTRVQQIGVKFFDEFKFKIPRAEVESIARIILEHARRFSPDFQMVIAGGYRRGKQQSGDVDVIISNPDESATLNFVEKLVVSLEKSKHITHTLTLSNHNSDRGQQPVSWKANESKGSGFDTLDKALVVWHEPSAVKLDESGGDATTGGNSKRPPHRRVDIILSPWKTVGCAVLGWSGDTTFQRDLRHYCKTQKNLKFDSSGIRSRLDGSWVDLEGGKRAKAIDMLEAERRVFEGLGLDWIQPEDRCTG